MAPYAEKYHEIKWTVLLNLELLKENALFWTDSINNLLSFEKGNNTFFEAQLRYCNFQLKYSN